jgi:hypothetical protein
MNLKKILVTESEKRGILKKHNLIKEQVGAKEILTVTKKIVFPGGKWKMTDEVKKLLDIELSKIKTKAIQGNTYLVAAQIDSSESKIPNTNNEVNPSEKVGPLWLSQQRLNTIKEYLKNELQSLVEKKILISEPKIISSEPKQSGPEWVGQDFCPADQLVSGDKEGYACEKDDFVPNNGKLNWKTGKGSDYATLKGQYTDAQNMSMTLKLVETTSVSKCLNNMEIQVNYTDVEKEHVCDSAVFRITVNGIALLRDDGKDYASLNNQNDTLDNNPNTCGKVLISQSTKKAVGVYIDKTLGAKSPACKRYNKFVISPELASDILAKTVLDAAFKGQPLFKIAAECLSNSWREPDTGAIGGCHDGVGDILVTNGEGKQTPYTSATPRKFGEIKTLVSMDACGTSKE